MHFFSSAPRAVVEYTLNSLLSPYLDKMHLWSWGCVKLLCFETQYSSGNKSEIRRWLQLTTAEPSADSRTYFVPPRYGITEFTCAQNVHDVPRVSDWSILAILASDWSPTTKCSWCPWVTLLLACVIFRFYSGISVKEGFRKTRKQDDDEAPKDPWWTNQVVGRVSFDQSDQCVIVCAQNVSGMVSTGLKEPVIGVHGVSRHPPPTPTQPKPDVCTCSHSPFSRHSLQPGQIWSRGGGSGGGRSLWWKRRGGNDWRRWTDGKSLAGNFWVQ